MSAAAESLVLAACVTGSGFEDTRGVLSVAGRVERFGGLAFANGGLDVQTGGTLCSDAFIARALTSAWEASRE